MPSFAEVKDQIQEIEPRNFRNLLKRSEILLFSDALLASELIRYIMICRYHKQEGILIATPYRLIFASDKCESFHYSEMGHIRYKSTMEFHDGHNFGRVQFMFNRRILEFQQVHSQSGEKFVELVRKLKSADDGSFWEKKEKEENTIVNVNPDEEKDPSKRKKWWITAISLVVCFIALGGYWLTNKPVTAEVSPHLGVDSEEFITEFNQYAKNIGSGLKLTKLAENDRQTFITYFHPSMRMVGHIALNGKIEKLIIVSQDGNPDFELAAKHVFQALNPGTSAKKTEELMEALGINEEQQDGTIKYSGLQYNVLQSNDLGTIFGVSPQRETAKSMEQDVKQLLK